MRRFYFELINSTNNQTDSFQRNSNGKFALRPGIKFHLYISSFNLLELSSKSNTESLSMPSFAKILRWSILGLQGALLSKYIEPVYLTSVIIGEKCDEISSYRNMITELEEHMKSQTLSPGYHFTKFELIQMSESKVNSCRDTDLHQSVTWNYNNKECEVISSATGEVIQHIPKTNGFVFGSDLKYSRLSKRANFIRFVKIGREVLKNINNPNKNLNYAEFKTSCHEYQEMKKIFFSACESENMQRIGIWKKKNFDPNNFLYKS